MSTMNRPVQRSAKVEHILDDLRVKIVLGQFPADETLAENMLAESYGVSRGTIRTALQVLASEGFVIVKSNGRKEAVAITDSFTEDLYVTRLMLERTAIEICMRKECIDSSVLSAAFGDFYKLFSYTGRELYEQRSIINTNFHRSVIIASGNISLLNCWDTIEPLFHSLTTFNYISLGETQSNEEIIEMHKRIMDLLLARDPAVYQEIENHITRASGDTRSNL